jgi:hypothetical protein
LIGLRASELVVCERGEEFMVGRTGCARSSVIGLLMVVGLVLTDVSLAAAQTAGAGAATCDCKALRDKEATDQATYGSWVEKVKTRTKTEAEAAAKVGPAVDAYIDQLETVAKETAALGACIAAYLKRKKLPKLGPVGVGLAIIYCLIDAHKLSKAINEADRLRHLVASLTADAEAATRSRVRAEGARDKALDALKISRQNRIDCQQEVARNVAAGLCPYATKPYGAASAVPIGLAIAALPGPAGPVVTRSTHARMRLTQAAAKPRARRRNTARVRLKTTLVSAGTHPGRTSVIVARGVFDYRRERGVALLGYNGTEPHLRSKIDHAMIYRYLPDTGTRGKPLPPWLVSPRGVVAVDPLMILTFHPDQALKRIRRMVPKLAFVGKARTRGVRTRHYRRTPTAGEFLAAVRVDARSVLTRALLNLRSAGPAVDAWIDRAGRLRRIAIRLQVHPARSGRRQGTVTAVGELDRFGSRVGYERPARMQTRRSVG